MVSANKTRKQRPCLHGERLANGKCPTKRKPCATGPRLANGKCPTKPCKHGARLANGKCPPSKNKTVRDRTNRSSSSASGSSAVCLQGMTYEECETTILRTFIKESDEINKKEMRSEDVDKMVDILESFIKKEKCVCYGGLAINNILPVKAQFYDRSSEIPDFDFYSPDAQQHAKNLANIFFKNGFEEVEAKSGVHPNTFKVFVNFIPVADITFMHPRLFQELQKHAIKKNDILYCPPDYLRMSMYLELSRPRGDVSRWEKVYKRLKLLNEYHPYKQSCIENTQMARVTPYNDIIRNEFIRQQVVFFGGFAFEQYEQNDYPFEMFVLALEPDKTASKVVEVLKRNGFPNAKFIEIVKKEVVEYIGKHYLIVVEEKVAAIVFSAVACHSYHEIDTEASSQKVRIATVFTMLSYYLLFLFMDEIYLDHAKLSCMAKRMFELEQKHKLSGKGLMKTLSLTCYGKQTTLRDMFSLKNIKYKQLGRLPNKTQEQWDEYNSFFFKYIPKQNAQHNMLQHQYRNNNNNGNNNGTLNRNNNNGNNNGNRNYNNNNGTLNRNNNNNGTLNRNNNNGNNGSNRNNNNNNNGTNRNYNNGNNNTNRNFNNNNNNNNNNR